MLAKWGLWGVLDSGSEAGMTEGEWDEDGSPHTRGQEGRGRRWVPAFARTRGDITPILAFPPQGGREERGRRLGGVGGFASKVGDAVVEGGPGEKGALDAYGKLTDALQGLHFADKVQFVVGKLVAPQQAPQQLR